MALMLGVRGISLDQKSSASGKRPKYPLDWQRSHLQHPHRVPSETYITEAKSQAVLVFANSDKRKNRAILLKKQFEELKRFFHRGDGSKVE